MPNQNKPKSTEELLQEMESLSKTAASSQPSPRADADAESKSGSKGALSSLLGFFIKIHDDDQGQAAPPANKSAAPADVKKQPAAPPPPSTPAPAQPPMPATPPSMPMSMPMPAKPAAMRKVEDLVVNEPPPNFAAKGDLTEDLSIKAFEDIYREAKIAKTITSVDELIQLMESPMVKNQPLSVKIVAVNLALSAKNTVIDDYIADAVRKDRALDAYQAMLNLRAADVENSAKAEIDRLQKEIEEFKKAKQAEMEKLLTQTAETNRQAKEFANRRQVEEQRLADAIAPFLEEKPNPVTVGNNPEEK
jgi:hypothetical protein